MDSPHNEPLMRNFDVAFVIKPNNLLLMLHYCNFKLTTNPYAVGEFKPLLAEISENT